MARAQGLRKMKKISLLGIIFLTIVATSSFVSVNAEIEWDEIEIQVRPSRGRRKTPIINPYSRGRISVAIISSSSFDASTADPTAVVFAGALAERWKLMDFDKDGDKDLIMVFKIRGCEDLPTTPGLNEVVLVGWAFGTQHFEGIDRVRIVPRRTSESSAKIIL